MSESVASDRELRAAARYERLLEVQGLMASVAREIGPALELERVLEIVLSAMRSLVDVDVASVVLIGEQDLYVAASDPPGADVAVPAGIAASVVRTGRAIYEPRAHDDRGAGSYLAVPLVVYGDVIGAMKAHADHHDAFGEDDRILLEGLATQVAGAIESARRFEQVAELEILKSDFIARVSHELRTPITIMSGFVSTLLAHHDDLAAGVRHQMLERVEVATARLSGLIDELLMLSKLEAGVVAATRERVQLVAVLDQVRIESMDPGAVTVVCDLDTEIETDPHLLVRALGLLVDNALKYAGAVELHGTSSAIEAVDHGPGIRPDAKARMFERFTRDTDLTTVPGMGIGLPMARTLLAALGADLLLEDTPGGGALLIVKFWD
jgi:signal transduction histidine kinase